MSYVRFSEGDVYVYCTTTQYGAQFVCCEFGGDATYLATRSEMIAHLERHEAAGHNTGSALEMLRAELADHGETEFRDGDG